MLAQANGRASPARCCAAARRRAQAQNFMRTARWATGRCSARAPCWHPAQRSGRASESTPACACAATSSGAARRARKSAPDKPAAPARKTHAFSPRRGGTRWTRKPSRSVTTQAQTARRSARLRTARCSPAARRRFCSARLRRLFCARRKRFAVRARACASCAAERRS